MEKKYVFFYPHYGVKMKQEEIKSENSKLVRRPQELQVWKGPTEPLIFCSFLAPTYNCVF